MSYDEWQGLPWWVRRVYIEGMMEEELIQPGPELDAWEADPMGTTMDSFRDAGFSVLEGGR